MMDRVYWLSRGVHKGRLSILSLKHGTLLGHHEDNAVVGSHPHFPSHPVVLDNGQVLYVDAFCRLLAVDGSKAGSDNPSLPELYRIPRRAIDERMYFLTHYNTYR